MKRNNFWLIMLIAIFALGIGYAAISNITLLINGSANAVQSLTDDEFIVRYVQSADTTSDYANIRTLAENPASYVITKFSGNTVNTTATAYVTGDSTATFNVSDMEKGDIVTFTYYGANLSLEDVTAYLSVDTDNTASSNNTNFEVTATIADSSLRVGEVTPITVKVECLAQETLRSVSGAFTITLKASVTEPANSNSPYTIYNTFRTASTKAEILDAINSSTNTNITLTDDIELTSGIIARNGGTVTIDLNGNNIKSTGNYAFAAINGTNLVLSGSGKINANGLVLAIQSGSRATIDGIDIISDTSNGVQITDEDSEFIINSGSITSKEAGIATFTKSKVQINGGTITSNDNCPVMGNGNSGQGDTEIIMNGGTLYGHIESAGFLACGVYLPNSGTFTMNGGSIYSDGVGIVLRGGTANLNGGTITATGHTGVKGKVGDSRVTVVPYAVVYEAKSAYPAYQTLQLNIANGVTLSGTDGAIATILGSNMIANISNNSTYSITNITE